MARKSFFHYFDIVDRDDSGLIEQNEVECKFILSAAITEFS